MLSVRTVPRNSALADQKAFLDIVFYEPISFNRPNGEASTLSILRNWTFLQNLGLRSMVIKHFEAFYSLTCRPSFLFEGIATIMHELETEKSALESDPEKLKLFFQEMIQMCLW